MELILSPDLEAGFTMLRVLPRRLMLHSVAVGAPDAFSKALLSVRKRGMKQQPVQCGEAAILDKVSLRPRRLFVLSK
jgi:hypothetical protein